VVRRGFTEPPPERPTRLLVPWQAAHQDVRDRIELGEGLLASFQSTSTDEIEAAAKRWNDYNYQLLLRIFDTEEIPKRKYGQSLHPFAVRGAGPERERHLLRDAIIDKINELKSVKDQLSLFADATPLMQAKVYPGRPVAIDNGKVFLVHGHDEAAKHETARFIEKLNLMAIVLQEQPNLGKTLIEKVETNSDVGYAVILVTPDDLGGASGTDLSARARENVILEVGFFLGKLGRSKLALLVKEGVTLPSDLQGIGYIPIDPAGAWRGSLAKEFLAAGLEFDVSKAL
jgi:predicted nucleotide-binding protein